MTKRDLEKSVQEIWDMFKETDRLLTEKFRETDQKIKEVTRAIGNLGGKWGEFVEGLLLPAVKRLFRERGIVLERIYRRAEVFRNGEKMEIDILAVNGDYAVLIEVKSTLGIDDVNEHLERLAKFRSYFPEYADRRVIGAVAGIVIQEGVDLYAYRQGLFVIGQSGDTVKILNDKKFKPKEW